MVRAYSGWKGTGGGSNKHSMSSTHTLNNAGGQSSLMIHQLMQKASQEYKIYRPASRRIKSSIGKARDAEGGPGAVRLPKTGVESVLL